MSVAAHGRAIGTVLRQKVVAALLGHRVRARHPTLYCHATVLWDYGFHDIDAIEIGRGVSVCAFAEILVYRRSPRTRIEGRLVLADEVIVSAGCNIRAAGGTISIGKRTGIGQNNVLVAANHALKPGESRLRTAWDQERCGVWVGANVWTGANCVLLPGCRIGDNAVIAAGSVVRGEIPSGELWGGVPARRLRVIEPAAVAALDDPA